MKSKSEYSILTSLIYLLRELNILFLIWMKIRDKLGELLETEIEENVDNILLVSEYLDKMFALYRELILRFDS